jgi:SSS family solute:Na+ symporter
MSEHVIALTVVFIIVISSVLLGIYAAGRRKMDLEQWSVAGRGLGLILVWLLMAGEVYTTFAFLGASGWSYSRGGPTLYIIAYLVAAYVVSFFILPQIWVVGKKFGMQTQSDFFAKRYDSKWLAALVSIIGFIFIIPYLQLQLTGLGIIMEVASFGAISRTAAMLIAFTIVAVFLLTSGIRGVAWISVIKDFLMLSAAIFIGIGLPYMYFGGIGEMFAALAAAKPEHLVMPGSTKVMGHSWYISTVLLTSLGFYMWPHLFSATFTAKSDNTLRRNAVIMPLYTVTLPLIFIVGFTALLVSPGLKNGDLALLTVVQKSYSAWFLGLIGAAGALTAMVPAAVLILAAATLFAKNFYRAIIKPDMTDDQVASLAKKLVVVITATALIFAIYFPTTLVELLLLGYAGVTQFLPGVVFGLYWRRVTLTGVFVGMVAGIATLAYLILGKMDPFMGINAGFVGLCVNFVLTVGISLITKAEPFRLDDEPVVSGVAAGAAK